MPNIELRKCPFCGSRTSPDIVSMAELDGVEDNEWYDTHFTVVCSLYNDGCGASVKCNNASKEEAAESWNRRCNDAAEKP